MSEISIALIIAAFIFLLPMGLAACALPCLSATGACGSSGGIASSRGGK